MALFSRLCRFEPMRMHIMCGIEIAFGAVDPNTSPAIQAEVPLQMLIILAQEFTSHQKEAKDTNPYYKLAIFIFQQNWLQQIPCTRQNSLTIVRYLEMVYRWSIFFKGQHLCQLISSIFLVKPTIKNSDPYVVLQTCLWLN